MARKERAEALAQLQQARDEFDRACADLKKKYKKLDARSDGAIELVAKVEQLVSSIRYEPFSYKAIKRKITNNKKQFISEKDLLRKERDNNIAAGAAFGVAAAGMTFFVFMKKICKKDAVRWIVGIALIVFMFAGYLIFKMFNRIHTIKRIHEEIKNISEATYRNRYLSDLADQQIEKIIKTSKAVQKLYDELQDCAKCNYTTLPEETKEKLGTLHNLTLTLTECINTKIG